MKPYKAHFLKYTLSAICLLCFLFPAVTEVSFSGLDITPDNTLLFKATAELPEWGSYDTLFYASLHDKQLTQLTFFPEKITLLGEKGELQIQNRFGVFRTDENLKNIQPVKLFPSFVGGQEIATGKLTPIQSSPDGKFLVFIRPLTLAFGELILYDIAKGQETVICKDFEVTFDLPLVLWSPDSQFLIYCSQFKLYYFSISQYNEKKILAQDYRQVAKGTLQSGCWGANNHFYYINGKLVYRVASSEFFTRSIYVGILRMGKIAGKIPFDFDATFDSFWISPDGQKILLNKGNSNLFLYFLYSEDFITIGKTKSLPYLYLPRNTFIKKVLWSKDDIITVLTISRENGLAKGQAFRLTVPAEGNVSAFSQLENNTHVSDISLSPDETQVLLLANKSNKVYIYDYRLWQIKKELDVVHPLHAIWRNTRQFLIASQYRIQLHSLEEQAAPQLITIAQAEAYGFSTDSKTIYIQCGQNYYRFAVDRTEWQPASSLPVRDKTTATSFYRVYVENTTRGSYKNIVMIRDIAGYKTVPLFPPEQFAYESFSSKVDAVDFDNFRHGSRVRGREVALIFDALESIEGLTSILNVLAEYGLRCTFFVNGEVIRRYPDAVREIAQSGHEVGSLFYMAFNMTDAKFNINKEFIKSGLARTEDEYFAATGKELSLLWHAPNYLINSEMIAASKEMNYHYIGRDVDPMDWVTKNTLLLAEGIYLPATKLVERVLEKKEPGSIIPILVGVPNGERESFLFQKLDLLINGLIKKGYRIVTVSRLLENAR